MAGPEKKFRNRVQKYIDRLPNTYSTSIQQVSQGGFPDKLLAINGAFVCIEYKASAKARVSPLQKYVHEKIRRAGGLVFVAYPENWDEVYEALTDLANVNPPATFPDGP